MINCKTYIHECELLLFTCRFPQPSAPEFTSSVPSLLPNAITIAVVAFAISVSMSKIFAKKHNYEIDADQVCLGNVLSLVQPNFSS